MRGKLILAGLDGLAARDRLHRRASTTRILGVDLYCYCPGLSWPPRQCNTGMKVRAKKKYYLTLKWK